MVSLGSYRRILLGACAALALSDAAAAGTAAADPDATAPTIEAVWKVQHLSFEYRAYNTLYTCSGLRSKLRDILTTLGARDGIKLKGFGCDMSGTARFNITLESPIEATPENVQALTRYSAEQELIARARGETLATAADLPRFPAQWKTVSFVRDNSMRLDPGDCELVQQLRREILPRLSVQIVRDNLRCSPYGNIGRPRLTVSALVAAPQHADATH